MSNLNANAIYATPIHTDWSEGYTERWNVVYPSFDECSAAELHDYLDDAGVDFSDVERDENTEPDWDDDYLDGLRDLAREEVVDNQTDQFVPMMNYRYPLPDYGGVPEDDQFKLLDTCLVLVEFDGDYFLALAGGGMDLSWEIARAYMLLGYLPPLHFVRDLPRYAGQEDSDDAQFEVLTAAKEAADVAARWNSGIYERFEAALAAREGK